MPSRAVGPLTHALSLASRSEHFASFRSSPRTEAEPEHRNEGLHIFEPVDTPSGNGLFTTRAGAVDVNVTEAHGTLKSLDGVEISHPKRSLSGDGPPSSIASSGILAERTFTLEQTRSPGEFCAKLSHVEPPVQVRQ
jgi:hypothetical protein